MPLITVWRITHVTLSLHCHFGGSLHCRCRGQDSSTGILGNFTCMTRPLNVRMMWGALGTGDVTAENPLFDVASPMQHQPRLPSACQSRCLSLPAQSAENSQTPLRGPIFFIPKKIRRTRILAEKVAPSSGGEGHRVDDTTQVEIWLALVTRVSPTVSKEGTVAEGGQLRRPDWARDQLYGNLCKQYSNASTIVISSLGILQETSSSSQIKPSISWTKPSRRYLRPDWLRCMVTAIDRAWWWPDGLGDHLQQSWLWSLANTHLVVDTCSCRGYRLCFIWYCNNRCIVSGGAARNIDATTLCLLMVLL